MRKMTEDQSGYLHYTKPVFKKSKEVVKLNFRILHQILIIFLSVAVLATFSLPAFARDLTAKEKEVIKKAVQEKLSDPESARFKWLSVSDAESRKSTGITYCGIVNAKNRFGGYVGDTLYYGLLVRLHDNSSPSFQVLVLGDEDFMAYVASEMCKKKGYVLP